MKVLLVSRWFWEERRRNNGQPGFLGELVEALVAKGVDLTILSQAADAGSKPQPRAIEGLNVHVFSRERRDLLLSFADKLIKPWGGYRKAATDAAVIRRFAQQRGPFDAVVAQSEEPDGLACALATLGGALPPLVTMVHDLRYRFERDRVRFVRRSSLGFTFDRSARVIANSEQTAAWLSREYRVAEEKIGQCRIHLTAPFVEAARMTKVPLELKRQRILFLGALNVKKAPDTFLRAAALLAPEFPDSIFVVVGPETSEDFHFRSQVNELASNPALAGRIELKGRLETAGVIDEIRRARVVVCPSRIETFSRTTIEALALGRPVIVTETTGAADWVRLTGAGAVVAANDPAALARAMHEWAVKHEVPDAATKIVAELTATQAADDLLREVQTALPVSRRRD